MEERPKEPLHAGPREGLTVYWYDSRVDAGNQFRHLVFVFADGRWRGDRTWIEIMGRSTTTPAECGDLRGPKDLPSRSECWEPLGLVSVQVADHEACRFVVVAERFETQFVVPLHPGTIGTTKVSSRSPSTDRAVARYGGRTDERKQCSAATRTTPPTSARCPSSKVSETPN